MGLDICVYQTCSKCRRNQSYELYRDTHDPFNIADEEQWKILNRFYKVEIADVTKAWDDLSVTTQDQYVGEMLVNLNQDCIKEYNGKTILSELERLRLFITHELKFDEDAFYFPACENCGKYLTVVCYSY